MKKTLALLLALLFCISFPMYAAALEDDEAGDIMPLYDYLAVLSWSFTIEDGISCSYATLTAYGWNDCQIKANIQRKEDGVWKSYKSFTTNGTDGSAGMDKYWALPSGYVYRCRFTFVVFDSNGTIIEDVTKYSDEVYCNS